MFGFLDECFILPPGIFASFHLHAHNFFTITIINLTDNHRALMLNYAHLLMFRLNFFTSNILTELLFNMNMNLEVDF